MKKFLLLLYFFAGCPVICFCQTKNGSNDEFFRKAAVLQKQLGLSNGQTSQITAIFRESSAEFQKIITNEHGDTEKILAAIGPLRAATLKKIIFLLTPVQAAKFNRLVAELTSPNGDQWTPDRPRRAVP
jgi:protein CpxP